MKPTIDLWLAHCLGIFSQPPIVSFRHLLRQYFRNGSHAPIEMCAIAALVNGVDVG